MDKKKIPVRRPFSFRVSPSELARLEEAAFRREQRVSSFVREVALAHAARVLKEAK